jgi:demethylmenaquinone methyltransferase / 2-methoxy-6-polyprenyl-1,4-benzoquinol methylase
MPQTSAHTSALPPQEEKAVFVRRMFSSIAPRYDLLNHLMTANLDRRWRRAAVDVLGWENAPQGTYLDTCSGTLDLAVELAGRPGFGGRVVGSDFTLNMLRLGVHKLERLPVEPACADALSLPFAAGAFDGATVGFGVRNLQDLDAGLREAARVLKPGARFVILELSKPTWQPFRAVFMWMFLHFIPFMGRLVSGHNSAYAYLPQSVARFPGPVELAERMAAAGFSDVRWRGLAGGVVALHWGTR